MLLDLIMIIYLVLVLIRQNRTTQLYGFLVPSKCPVLSAAGWRQANLVNR